MRKRISILALCLAVLLTVGLLTACGGSGLSEQMLVGKWTEKYKTADEGISITLRADGTGVFYGDGIDNLIWKLDGKYIIFQTDDRLWHMEIQKFTPTELTLTDEYYKYTSYEYILVKG